jgi:hypothetical protein
MVGQYIKEKENLAVFVWGSQAKWGYEGGMLVALHSQ